MLLEPLDDIEKKQLLTILHDNANALLIAMPDGTVIAKGRVDGAIAGKSVLEPEFVTVAMPRELTISMPGAYQSIDAVLILCIYHISKCFEADTKLYQLATDTIKTIRVMTPASALYQVNPRAMTQLTEPAFIAGLRQNFYNKNFYLK